MFPLLLTGAVVLFGFTLTTASTETPTLVAVFSVIRHGDRSPTSFYPNDPFKNESFWPDGVGEMNKWGRDRMSQSGTLYFQRYKEFLRDSDGWPVYAKSSVRNRAIQSADLFLGSFLKEDKPLVNVSSMIVQDQLMLTTTYPCNKSNIAWLNWFSSGEVTGYIANNTEGIKRLENYTGDFYLSQTPYTLRNLEFLATTLEIERDEWYKLNVPSWAREQSNIDLMADLKRHAYLFDWRPADVQRYRVGPLLGDIRDNIAKVVNGSSKQRFFLYSTHDVNQVLLLQALNMYEQIGNWPTSYSSAIVVEVYNTTDGQYLLRTLYREVVTTDSSTSVPLKLKLVDHPLNITACNDLELTFESNQTESWCLFEHFQTLIHDKVPLNYDQECRTNSGVSSSWWPGHLSMGHNLLSVFFLTWVLRHMHNL